MEIILSKKMVIKPKTKKRYIKKHKKKTGEMTIKRKKLKYIKYVRYNIHTKIHDPIKY